MTARQRFTSTLLFRGADRIPLEPGRGRESTLKAWHGQGLPAEVQDAGEASARAYREAGGRLELPRAGEGFPVDARMIPWFEEKVLESREDRQVVQDWKGNVCEIGREFSVRHLREAIDFVTRRWIRCPVESRADWQDMARRYDPDEPSRLPPQAAALGARLTDRTWPVSVSLNGPFWQLREWLGFERLCMLFYDDEALLSEMLTLWSDFGARLLQRIFACFVPDEIHLSEDMAFKEHSMISPAMVRERLLPIYLRWGELIREAGCPIYAMDSDGYIGELIPIWMEAGINACDPIEAAAGNDINAFRARFGRRMAFRGGVDKRAIAKGDGAIEREMTRVAPVIADGGYIPGCDHGVPPDVSWPDYVRYTGLLARATGWL
jgi:hypothetical protein